jgi:hypothetical protein
MSAIAAGEGAYVAERVGQLTMPPIITTMRNSREAAPMTATRVPCRATGTRAAIEPVDIGRSTISVVQLKSS